MTLSRRDRIYTFLGIMLALFLGAVGLGLALARILKGQSILPRSASA